MKKKLHIALTLILSLTSIPAFLLYILPNYNLAFGIISPMFAIVGIAVSIYAVNLFVQLKKLDAVIVVLLVAAITYASMWTMAAGVQMARIV